MGAIVVFIEEAKNKIAMLEARVLNVENEVSMLRGGEGGNRGAGEGWWGANGQYVYCTSSFTRSADRVDRIHSSDIS